MSLTTELFSTVFRFIFIKLAQQRGKTKALCGYKNEDFCCRVFVVISTTEAEPA